MLRVFLHGLESSSKGTKATFLRERFPGMLIPDFHGSLAERMESLAGILDGYKNLIITGSSFGGLMATVYAMQKPESVNRLVLLAPALNFPEFANYPEKAIGAPTSVFIGTRDDVTPVKDVFPLAAKIFTRLEYKEVDDDHMLAGTFRGFDWETLLRG